MKQSSEEPNERDALWALLGESKQVQPGSRFVDDTLRRIRLEDGRKAGGWMSFFKSPLGALASAGGLVTACLILAFTLVPDQTPKEQIAEQDTVVEEIEPLDELGEELEDELLSLALDSPSLFSDDELIELIF